MIDDPVQLADGFSESTGPDVREPANVG
jgi:hypothetical protein